MPLAVLIFLVVVGLSAMLAIAASRVLPPRVERALSKIEYPPPYQIPQSAQVLHARLPVVDLHADPLLWKRDLLKRSNYGHVDVPRLLEGGVALQVFGVVTKVPRGLNFESNSADSDLITPLALAQAWPPRTWGSLLQRALYQAPKLEGFAARSEGRLAVVRTARGLRELIARIDQSQPRPQQVGGLLALEGVHALENDVANLDVLYDAGFRIRCPHAYGFFGGRDRGDHGAQRPPCPGRATTKVIAGSSVLGSTFKRQRLEPSEGA